ncbi:MAG: hypothetical protein ABF483_04800 [Liquorilactobacillus nagelii]|uniref:hypothetical protein n=1 Tax=Liquorilactobacillus nagelii TaxID=82688 RepID=UPI001C9E86C8|nr:hypothetical protein [Liquorilactobacillus nagelii]
MVVALLDAVLTNFRHSWKGLPLGWQKQLVVILTAMTVRHLREVGISGYQIE